MLTVYLSPIPNQLHPADHLANGEEPEHFRKYHAASNELRPVHVAYTREHRLGRHGRGIRSKLGDGGGIAGEVDHWLEVGLEGLDRAVAVSVWVSRWERGLRWGHLLALEDEL